MTATDKRQVHLAAHFPGVNATTIWSDPSAGSQTEFSSFRHFAATAERGLFDFIFLAEGLRLREHAGRIHDLDVVGRPDTLTVLAALAAVTERIGLVGTLNSTFNEPYELARQLASVDAVSRGRAGWNVVTSSDAFTGANFRRGGFLPHADRYRRAGDFVDTAWELWDAAGTGEPVRHESPFFDIEAVFPVPASRQGRPVILQAGVSGEGRDVAAKSADAIFSPFAVGDPAREFSDDLTQRLASFGRPRSALKILPGATFVIGDDEADAAERAYAERRAQISGATAVRSIEALWGIELDGVDPDGPLPDVALLREDVELWQGRAMRFEDRRNLAEQWAARAEAESLSIRELAIAVAPPATFVGTASSIAERIDEVVQSGATDGFILVPSLTPHGLDRFTDEVVPLLQERGVYRTEYEGTTLRDILGVPLSQPAALV
ncbi:LLM class flavin-dependent oxidoreductase [Microbacterium sp. AZCO]|uniref:LLM class flavin-dependent oxidoreductase n=1 Tax=Microbacterium sp. AZCO TaxID=3142976 RepID=UPI0031F3CE79